MSLPVANHAFASDNTAGVCPEAWAALAAALKEATGRKGKPLFLPLRQALAGARSNEFAALRYDAWLKRLNREPLPVHVIVTDAEDRTHFVVELVPQEQQTRQDREERALGQAQAVASVEDESDLDHARRRGGPRWGVGPSTAWTAAGNAAPGVHHPS